MVIRRQERQEIMDKFNSIHEKVMVSLLTLNLFVDEHIEEDGVNLIDDKQLAEIPIDLPFDSDSNGVIVNTKVKSDIPGHHFISQVKPNGFIKVHKHETDKILKTLCGEFYDEYSDKWYYKGDYLYLTAGDLHNILAGANGAELLTFIMAKKYE